MSDKRAIDRTLWAPLFSHPESWRCRVNSSDEPGPLAAE